LWASPCFIRIKTYGGDQCKTKLRKCQPIVNKFAIKETRVKIWVSAACVAPLHAVHGDAVSLSVIHTVYSVCTNSLDPFGSDSSVMERLYYMTAL